MTLPTFFIIWLIALFTLCAVVVLFAAYLLRRAERKGNVNQLILKVLAENNEIKKKSRHLKDMSAMSRLSALKAKDLLKHLQEKDEFSSSVTEYAEEVVSELEHNIKRYEKLLARRKNLNNVLEWITSNKRFLYVHLAIGKLPTI